MRMPSSLQLPVPRMRWLALALGLVAAAAEAEQGGQDEKLARLGFAFDQKAHDAAVAKAKNDTAESGYPGPDEPGLLRLPKHVVTGEKVEIEEQRLLTPKGREAVAKERHTSPLYRKTFGVLAAVAGLVNNPLGGWNPNTPEAMAIYEDLEQKRRNQEIGELTALAGFADLVKASAKTPAKDAEKKK